MSCEHENFTCITKIARLTAVEGGQVIRWDAAVQIICSDCGHPFRFLGLPIGSLINGAATSVDGEEARLAIAPRGGAGDPVPLPAAS